MRWWCEWDAALIQWLSQLNELTLQHGRGVEVSNKDTAGTIMLNINHQAILQILYVFDFHAPSFSFSHIIFSDFVQFNAIFFKIKFVFAMPDIDIFHEFEWLFCASVSKIETQRPKLNNIQNDDFSRAWFLNFYTCTV